MSEQQLREALEKAHLRFCRIQASTRCPDPAEGGCIPSDACAHEQASAGLRDIDAALADRWALCAQTYATSASLARTGRWSTESPRS